jgi:hypothetical protein
LRAEGFLINAEYELTLRCSPHGERCLHRTTPPQRSDAVAERREQRQSPSPIPLSPTNNALSQNNQSIVNVYFFLSIY